jgi:hypothetical protein
MATPAWRSLHLASVGLVLACSAMALATPAPARAHGRVGVGRARVQNCRCYGPSAFTRYRTHVVLARPARCADEPGVPRGAHCGPGVERSEAPRAAGPRRSSGAFFVPTGRRSGFGPFRESEDSNAALRRAFGPPDQVEPVTEYSCRQHWSEIGVAVLLVAFGEASDACAEGVFFEARLSDPRWHTASGVHPGGPRGPARRASVRRCRHGTIGCAASGYALELQRTDCASTLGAGVIAHVRGRRVASLNVYWRSCE